jgi:anthranilate 1,2-dioxygenase large subunit
MRALRLKQANLVGPAGYISMEDTEATELVQQGVIRDQSETSIIDMGKDSPGQTDTLITETLIRSFWRGYRQLMNVDLDDAAAFAR